MATIGVHQTSQSITCHAWSPDQSMIAISPSNNEVHIYRLFEDRWERLQILQKHDQFISGIDWSNKTNRIVTSSHDRNSYVWNSDGSEWQPTLVVLRLNRAALCVKWSPKENKFAVGTGAKTVCICYYEQENNWWISKLIRKGHESSVTNVSWHPNNTLLATTSTDGKCRVFYAFIKVVDAKDTGGMSSDTRFGELIVQLDLSASWTFSVKWSPKGDTLVYAGQNSMIYFVNNVGSSPVTQSVACRDLPLRDVLFISEKMVIGVGFDCVPAIFVADERGRWSFVRYLGERVSCGAKYSSEFYDTFGRFCGTIKNDAVETSRISKGTHEKCINCILPFRGRGTLIKRFSTSGLDGKVIIWDLERQQGLLEYIINPL